MPRQTFIVNGSPVTLDVHPDVRVLWVLRDLLHVTGPKYGCGINVCKACTSHINNRAFNPCSVRVGDLKPMDRIDTIEGLPRQAGLADNQLHPMQQAWIDRDVAQCGYCQPGQIMAAVALVKKVRRQGREINESDLDNIRNICRCGTYTRIREAIMQGAAAMAAGTPAQPGVNQTPTPIPGTTIAGTTSTVIPVVPAKKKKKRKKKKDQAKKKGQKKGAKKKGGREALVGG